MTVKTGIKYGETIDSVPIFVDWARYCCQGWKCNEIATWNRWAGFYCTHHAILAGWLPGPIRRPYEQLVLS